LSPAKALTANSRASIDKSAMYFICFTEVSFEKLSSSSNPNEIRLQTQTLNVFLTSRC
jgi:hypothetical protein